MVTKEIALELYALLRPVLSDEDLNYFTAEEDCEDWEALARMSVNVARYYNFPLPEHLTAAVEV